MKKKMFKKVELWVVALLCVLFLIVLICYGAVLRHEFLGGPKFPIIRKTALFLAEIPYNLKPSMLNRKIAQFLDPSANLIISNKHSDKPRFKRFIQNEREELLLLARYDGNLNRPVVEIVDLNTFKVLHTYKHDIDTMKEKIDTEKVENKRAKGDNYTEGFVYQHPLILLDGNLVSHHRSPLFKIDFCSNLIWINQEEQFHHFNNLDHEGNYWVGAEMYPYSEIVNKYKKKYGFKDSAISKVSPDGKILYIKSVIEILSENNLIDESIFNFNNNDPLHLNDAEPVLKDSPYWKRGDVFISVANQSAILHYRPSENKLVNFIKGPFYQQHDVDIISNKEISIFNNNNHLTDNKFSEVIIYNFETQSFSTKFNNQLIRNNFKTESSGLVDFLPDGSMMVEERNYGRILFLDKNGNLEWEYINKDEKGDIYRLTWSRFIKDHDLIQNIKHKINNSTCLN